MKRKFLFLGQWLAAGIVALLLGEFGLTSASADSLPVKIAVFDFELDDSSAGAGIAGDMTADAAHLNQATGEARRLMSQSGRYSPVDVSATDDEVVKNHRLRQCDGCEAAIARKLGAQQSFLGVVTRISRTEYVVRFQIRDAHTGEIVLAPQSGLRMGANYSWGRGTASLIRSDLLHQ